MLNNDVIPQNRTDDVALQHWSQLFEPDKQILIFSQFPMAFLHGFIYFFKHVNILQWIIFDIVFVELFQVLKIRKKLNCWRNMQTLWYCILLWVIFEIIE